MLRRHVEGLDVDFYETFNFDLEIGYTRIGYKYRNENSFHVLLWVYALILRNNANLSPNLEIEYVGFFRCQKHKYDHEIFP